MTADISFYKFVSPKISLWPTLKHYYNDSKYDSLLELKNYFEKENVVNVFGFDSPINLLKL